MKRGPQRKGSLYWTKSGWRARVRVEEFGQTVQKSVNLETRDKGEARVALRRFLTMSAPTSALSSTERISRLEERVIKLERLLDEMIHTGDA